MRRVSPDAMCRANFRDCSLNTTENNQAFPHSNNKTLILPQ
jgi:hypothetical protein